MLPNRDAQTLNLSYSNPKSQTYPVTTINLLIPATPSCTLLLMVEMSRRAILKSPSNASYRFRTVTLSFCIVWRLRMTLVIDLQGFGNPAMRSTEMKLQQQ